MVNLAQGISVRSPASGASIGQLRALAALLRTESFARAAVDLGTSRAYVWQQLRRLEAHLSEGRARNMPRVRLTLPGSGRLTPTGEALAIVASRIVDETDAFGAVMRDVQAGIATVRVACLPAQAPLVVLAGELLLDAGSDVRTVLTDADDAFRRDFGTLLNQLDKRQVDIVVGPPPVLPNDTLSVIPLYRWTLIAVAEGRTRSMLPATTDGQGRTEVDLRDIAHANFRVLASPRGHATRDLLVEAVPDLDVAFESESVDAVFSLARLGWGAGLIASDALPVRQAATDQRWPIVTNNGEPVSGIIAASSLRSQPANAPALHLVSALREVIASDPAFQAPQLRWLDNPSE